MNKLVLLMTVIPSLAFSQQKPVRNFQHIKSLSQQASGMQAELNAEAILASVYFISGQRTDTFAFQNVEWNSSDSMQWLYNPKDSTLLALVHLVNDVDSGWINYVASYFYYDGRKNDTATRLQFWDNDLKTWDNESRILNSYDANNNLVTSTFQIWDSMAYKNSSLFSYLYNAANKITELSTLNWNSTTQQWDSSQKFVYSFDSINRPISEIDYVYGGASYFQTNQYLTYYNVLQVDTATVAQLWTGTKWANNYRDSSAYDASANKTLAQRMGYEQKTKAFDLTQSKINYQYNAGNQLTTETISLGNGATVFNPISQTSFSYDGAGNNNYSLIQVYDTASKTFVNFERDYYYYTTFISGIAAVHSTEPKIFLAPNPAGDLLNIEMNSSQQESFKLQVISSGGTILMDDTYKSVQGPSVTQLNLSGLPKGLYFVRVIHTASLEQQTFPFVKQ